MNTKKHHVVVIGAGFGGLYAVKQFVNTDIDVTLIDLSLIHI